MGVLVEHFSDDKGIVWPENIAPASVYLVQISDDAEAVTQADDMYKKLTDAGVAVLYDDRDERAGAKFADADLLGIPHRIVISKKTCENNQHEYKHRTSDETETYSSQALLQKLVA
jgi:prolyl-tRNA synthetase